MNDLWRKFDEVLINHIERLVGTQLAIGGLPLNLITVSCLIFLAEQDANEKENLSEPEDRYTHDTLHKALDEIGLGDDSVFAEAIREMDQKDYVQIEASGFISTKDTVLKMSRVIDNIFPKMPGLNLIAYIAQTIDEAASGRKDIQSAVAQFNQTLMLQGVPLKKERKKGRNKSSGKQVGKENITSRAILSQEKMNPYKSASGDLLSASDYDRLYQTTGGKKKGSQTAPGPRIISSGDSIDQSGIQEIYFGVMPFTQNASDKDSGMNGDDADSKISGSPSEESDDEGIRSPAFDDNVAAETDSLRCQEKPQPDTNTQESECSGEAAPTVINLEEDTSAQKIDDPKPGNEIRTPVELKLDKVGDSFQSGGIDYKQDIEKDDLSEEWLDDIVESRISTFEEDLAMQCPVCRSARIVPEKTVKGKTYYKCPNKACNFISWGKPYHYTCPRCQNPFLIESEKNGETILMCPRATCRYWQGGSKESRSAVSSVSSMNQTPNNRKPRRRVVKRRVVRRKK